MNRVTLSYLLVVLIWGSTWFAIKYQLSISPTVSVFYRFLLAAIFGFIYCHLTKLNLRFSVLQHRWMAFQGVCLFSMNYILFYYAEQDIPSGLVAATFTLVIYFNMIGLRLIFGKPFSLQILSGSVLGGAGIILLFWDSFQNFEANSTAIRGMVIGVIATAFASAGNLISIRLSRDKIPILAGSSWGMLYGSVFTLFLIYVLGHPFQMDFSVSYLSSLFYLAIAGSVIAFGAYLTLIAKIGADRAAYINILTPVIALLLSSVFEKFQWQWWTFAGVILCAFGNYLAIHWKPTNGNLIRNFRRPVQ